MHKTKFLDRGPWQHNGELYLYKMHCRLGHVYSRGISKTRVVFMSLTAQLLICYHVPYLHSHQITYDLLLVSFVQYRLDLKRSVGMPLPAATCSEVQDITPQSQHITRWNHNLTGTIYVLPVRDARWLVPCQRAQSNSKVSDEIKKGYMHLVRRV